MITGFEFLQMPERTKITRTTGHRMSKSSCPSKIILLSDYEPFTSDATSQFTTFQQVRNHWKTFSYQNVWKKLAAEGHENPRRVFAQQNLVREIKKYVTEGLAPDDTRLWMLRESTNLPANATKEEVGREKLCQMSCERKIRGSKQHLAQVKSRGGRIFESLVPPHPFISAIADISFFQSKSAINTIHR